MTAPQHATATSLLDEILDALSAIDRSVNSEAELQAIVEVHLGKAFPGRVRSQVCLGAAGRVDVMVDAVAIELKTQGSFVAILRQCSRYARSDDVDAVILVSTTRALVQRMPDRLCGRPIRTLVVGVGGRP